MTEVLLAVVLLPALLAPWVVLRGRVGDAAREAAPWAALPALAVALVPRTVPAGLLEWMLLGSWLAVDTVGQLFLLFTAMLWTAAGVYARGYLRGDARRGRYLLFHLLTLSGNLGVIVAHDLATFYLFFALMTFSAYGLIVHAGTAEALRAGRVYIAMAVLGEALLLTGLVLAARHGGSLRLDVISATLTTAPNRDLVLGLLLAGFGIKAGAVPLHVWLPLAHPVAPTPASAVLSGAMIKAGLLGWLRFLPLGEAALPGWSATLIALGLAAAFFGVVIGVLQTDPKTALAYSSISQMGYLNLAVGLGLADPVGWRVALAAALVYAVHHGLAKGALFLGVGVLAGARTARGRRVALAGLAFAGLALAGAPLTSGSAAKYLIEDAAALAPAAWPLWIDAVLPLAALGTTLLMGRVLILAWREAHDRAPTGAAMTGSWAALLAAVAGVVWFLPGRYELDVASPPAPEPASVWVAIWPIVAGALLLWALVWLRTRLRGWRPPRVAPGDLLIPVERVLGRLRGRLRLTPAEQATPVASLASIWYGVYAESGRDDRLLRAELALTGWAVGALLALLLVALSFFVLAGG